MTAVCHIKNLQKMFFTGKYPGFDYMTGLGKQQKKKVTLEEDEIKMETNDEME